MFNLIEGFLNGLTNGYRWLLRNSLRVRPLVLLIGLGVAGSSYVLFGQIKSELAPTEDRGTIVGIAIAPEGSTIEYTDRYTRRSRASTSRSRWSRSSSWSWASRWSIRRSRSSG